MDHAAASGRTARVLAALAVLLGLLAMHGLANAHHTAASPLVSYGDAAAAVSLADANEPAPQQQHRHAALQRAAASAPALTTPAGPACDAGCPSIAAVCVAVLAGTAFALCLARTRQTTSLPSPPRASTRTPAPPVRHARGPDPVRELCVSRT